MLNKYKNQNHYESTSLSLAATLICLGIPLDSVMKTTHGKSTFAFIRTDNFDELLEAFWKRSLQVEPNAFYEAQRFIKSRLYEN